MSDEIICGQDQQIRIAIMNDIHEGKSPFFIINRLLDYVADKSGEKSFATVAKENIRSIYGIGLNEPHLLKDELQEILEREQRLKHAYDIEESEEHKKRIEYALLAHQKRAEQLQKILEQSS